MPKCSTNPLGYSCGKDPQVAEQISKDVKDQGSSFKPKDAELWLGMMGSMLNFAMASTTLMKSIQNKVGVSPTQEREKKSPIKVPTEKNDQKYHGKPEMSNSGTSPMESGTDKVGEDCNQGTCLSSYIKQEPKGELCSGNCKEDEQEVQKPKAPISRLPVPINRKKQHKYSAEAQEKIRAVKSDQNKPEEKECDCPVEEECAEEPSSCEDINDSVVSNDTLSCGCSVEEGPERVSSACPPTEIGDGQSPVTSAAAQEEVASESCSCDSEESYEEEKGEEVSVVDCECQTDQEDSTENLIAKELQLANLTYQLRQTDENLRELRKEVDRITSLVSGKRKSPDEISAALYQEIMKPRTSIVEVISPSSTPKQPRRNRQNWR